MKALETETAPLGIGSGRISYLFMLYIKEGLTQQEMANRLQADKGAVARTLAQLEELANNPGVDSRCDRER